MSNASENSKDERANATETLNGMKTKKAQASLDKEMLEAIIQNVCTSIAKSQQATLERNEDKISNLEKDLKLLKDLAVKRHASF